MRILHTSDWHLGRMLENVSRLEEQRNFIDNLCTMADEHEIDMVLVAGDIYDTYNPPAAAEELFYEALHRLCSGGRRAVVIVAGNHDNPDRLCAASPLAYKNGIVLLGYPASDPGLYKGWGREVQMADAGPGWLELHLDNCKENVVLITLPYPSESRLEEVISADVDEGQLQKAYSQKVEDILSDLSQHFRQDTVNLIISHLFVRGGKESESERTIQVGGALTVDPGAFPACTHYAALGHLHRPQKVEGAPCPVYYSGSPLAYSFSEADYCKAVMLVEAAPGQPAAVQTLPLYCGKPLRRWVARQGIEEALAWCAQGRDASAWIDLEIHTDRILSTEEQKTLRSMNPGIIHIRPVMQSRSEAVESSENRELRKIDDLFREFYQYKVGVEISDELMAAFIDILNDEETDILEGGDGLETQIS